MARLFRQFKSLGLGPLLAGVGGITGATIIGYNLREQNVHCATAWDENRAYPSPKWDYNWDKREPYSLVRPPSSKSKPKKRSTSDKENVGDTDETYQEQLDKKKSKAVRHIFFIRHGQYNLNGSGDCEQKLTELGQRQAKATGQRLSSLGIKFDSLTSSTMSRAIETADIIAKQLPAGLGKNIVRDSMLNEGVPASPEPPVNDWHHNSYDAFIDGGRIEAAFRKYVHRANPKQPEDSYEIVVCHGNVIRYFFCRGLQFPGEAWLRISLKHASITCLSILPSGRVVLRSLGDSGHLPPDMLSVS